MVAYNDVPTVNALYEEQAKIDNGIALLDAGGTVGMFTVIPPPIEPQLPPGTTPMMMMSVQIMTTAPSSALIAEARNAMVARHNAITTELETLGVTAAPPTR